MNSATSPEPHRGDDPFAHLFAGQFQVLADVGQALVAGGVGVVGDDRDARLQRRFDRRVERVQVDQRDRDPVGAARDGGVDRVDHLVDVAAFRARPLVAAAEQFAGVRGAVLGGHEERVGRDVVDEHEFVVRVRAEHAADPLPPLRCSRTRSSRTPRAACSTEPAAAPVSAVRRRNARRSNPGCSTTGPSELLETLHGLVGLSRCLTSAPPSAQRATWAQWRPAGAASCTLPSRYRTSLVNPSLTQIRELRCPRPRPLLGSRRSREPHAAWVYPRPMPGEPRRSPSEHPEPQADGRADAGSRRPASERRRALRTARASRDTSKTTAAR